MYRNLLGDPLDSTLDGLDMHTITVIWYTTVVVLAVWLASIFFRLASLFSSHHLVAKGGPFAVIQQDDSAPDWISRELAARMAVRDQADLIQNELLQAVSLPVAIVGMQRKAGGMLDLRFRVTGVRGVQFVAESYFSRRAWRLALFEGSLPVDQLHVVESFEAGPEERLVEVELPEELGEEGFFLVCWCVPDHSTLAMLLNADASVVGRYLFHIGLERPMRLEETFSSADEDRECIICADALVNTIILPCRHNSICSVCLARVDKCPECRANIRAFIIEDEQV